MKYLKDPLYTIAVNTSIFIFGCIIFILFLITAVIIENNSDQSLQRTEHLKQHDDEQEKFDKMIELLEDIKDSINSK